ncbi:MAG: DUF952 domain-containing protein [Hyphomicrobiales bacterium]|nr:MAG: DUF952 domain-containing protein [Hyphomicrobiales bacterium]
MVTPEFIYKIASRPVFEASAAAGRFAGMPIDLKDGYVHFSTAAQLAETLRLHFAGEGDLIVFAIRCDDLGAGLRWEPSRGGQLFPHHYGELPMSLVGERTTLSVAADGSVTLPEWVQ